MSIEKEKIWLSSPHMGDREIEYVKEAFETNWIAPLGPHVNAFEFELQTYNKIAHAAALSSGTAALHLALLLLNTQPGDYVLCQSFTFCGSANAIRYTGAQPIFIDSEPHSWNIDPNALEEAIKTVRNKNQKYPGKIRAIMPVHLYGMPAAMDDIMTLSRKYNIPVVEDAAESLGASYDGRKTGTIGDLGAFSFNGNKIITTSGGGALVSNKEAWIEKARFLATQARDPAPYYQHTEIGYNYRLSNVLAGIGRGQLEVLDERIQQRKQVFQSYVDWFSNWGVAWTPQTEIEKSNSNRWLSAFDFSKSKWKPEDIRQTLAKENIECRPLWKPMHLQPVHADCPYFGGNQAERLFQNGLCFPSGSNLTPEHLSRIKNALEQCLSQP
ncbi:MAG: aminotransferase class I/II-fold pyridoxal phosphate-dependent enzyme [Bacteroidetes bacterium]|jgi:dTDP-4-amino-4,6-dideoxygalactose transaminase|nr:aminotransferase class I/II-fold pyridoxal phosphate-dependent enzyme [Bacteroidota bacterium]